MPAQSLLDASAMPSWLTGQPDAPDAPQQRHNSRQADVGVPGQSLVDERAVPQWMRTEGENAAAQAGPQRMPLSGTDGRMPAWPAQPYAGPQLPPGAMPPMPPAPLPAYGSPAGPPAPAGALPAGQFVDDSALPAWLRAHGGTAAPVPSNLPGSVPSPMQMPPQMAPPPLPHTTIGRVAAALAPGWAAPLAPGERNERPHQTFSAADLVDPSVLPDWVDTAGGSPPPPGAGRPENPNGERATDSRQIPQMRESPNDLAQNELPPWLRSGQPGNPGMTRQPDPSAYGRDPRDPRDPQQWNQRQWGPAGPPAQPRAQPGAQPGWGDPRQYQGAQGAGWNPSNDGYDDSYDDGGYDAAASSDGRGDARDRRPRKGLRRLFRGK